MAPPRIKVSAVINPLSSSASRLSISDDEADGEDRYQDQKRPAKDLGAAGEDSEGGAGVAHIGEVKQSVDDRDRLMERHRPVDDELGQLIENDNRREPPANALPLSAQADAPAFSTRAQRGQTVGWLWSAPTLTSYFQQRSHFAPSALLTVTRQLSSGAS